MLLYKKCEVCGNNINKLQSIWNLYEVSEKNKFSIVCKNCQTRHKPKAVFYMFLRFLPTDVILGNVFCALFVWLVFPPMQWWLIIIISIAFWHIINFGIVCIMPFYKDSKN
ncbi:MULTISPECIES: hypothetical protein [Helicobacter]|uniref:hypothetical protein n=1 Tax=Helicobacter TaxID=209 RepID=UPI00055176D6|nr:MULTISPECIES: hypothetical protein [Helicobacter]QOQ91289.1 hypothetical protein HW260_02805 [Helicobacter cinaedi]QOQ95481.1 hypothetical protein HW245_07450 [Helicobacter cinaedi]STP14510.1 Uncharacterised protein [Helicobacter fennelliae]